MMVVMAITWAVAVRIDNAGIVDVVWTFSVGLLGAAFASLGTGDLSRRWIIAVPVLGWSLRLGLHVLLRVLHEPEDGRYRELKAKAGEKASRTLFWFFQAQAFGAALFSMPMLLASTNEQPLGLLDYLALGVWLFSIGGESLSDRQLKRFKADPQNRGKVCNVGLWRYSRHPNYFFEWLHWWAYALFAVGAPWGWLSIIAPLSMLYFLLYVTGIPPTEAQSLRSRGEAYRDYQRTTSAFFPWFPKANAS
jgi:steroid 5-alpha reductase family enzyme